MEGCFVFYAAALLLAVAVPVQVLCLNHNRIEQLVADTAVSHFGTDCVLTNLQVLHLAYNGISSMASLQLNRIPSLKALFLQGRVDNCATFRLYRLLFFRQ